MITHKMLGCFVVLLFVAGPVAEYRALADVDYDQVLVVRCRKEINGVTDNYNIEIDLKNPPAGDNDGWGTVKVYTDESRTKKNCNCKLYNYSVVTIDHDWTAVEEVDGVDYTFTHEDNKRYWDWYYSGYDPPEKCDYTKNCHGFAFGVGDWPDSAVDILPQTVPTGDDACYESASEKEAQIASDPPAHSIRVVGTECDAEPEPGMPISSEPIKVQAIIKSEEQFLESGTYTRTVECPESLNLKEPGKDHENLTFSFYKKTDAECNENLP